MYTTTTIAKTKVEALIQYSISRKSRRLYKIWYKVKDYNTTLLLHT